jgi:tyrosinase
MLRYLDVMVALLCLCLPIGARAEVSVEIGLRGVDPFICWSPALARARVIGSNQDQKVVLRSERLSPSSGDVIFLSSSADFQAGKAQTELQVTLLKDSSWTDFLIAGRQASTLGRDVTITASVVGTSYSIGAFPLMVRVRKNANDLTDSEKYKFLHALAEWKAIPGRAEEYAKVHGDAAALGIHSYGGKVTNFLPWHRAFILAFERELQAIDSEVAIPYWKFDEKAKDLFTEQFLGAKGDANQAVFGNGNPLADVGYHLARSLSFLTQSAPYPVTKTALSNLLCKSAAGQDPCSTEFQQVTNDFETSYHNKAHSLTGGTLLDPSTAALDPLFFLIHANVDRAWAKWQALNDRFAGDGVNKESYDPIGEYPGPATTPRYRKGLYARDTMWPWSPIGPVTVAQDNLAEWETYRVMFPESKGLMFSGQDAPTPAKMIDYLGKNNYFYGHGVCYDDTPF